MKITLLATSAMILLAYGARTEAGSYDPAPTAQVSPAMTCRDVHNHLWRWEPDWTTPYWRQLADACGLTPPKREKPERTHRAPARKVNSERATTCTTKVIENEGEQPRFERITTCSDGRQSAEEIDVDTYLGEGGQ